MNFLQSIVFKRCRTLLFSVLGVIPLSVVAQVNITVLETYPDIGVEAPVLETGQHLYLRIAYAADTAFKIRVVPSFEEREVNVTSSDSPTLPAGQGETLAWIRMDVPGQMDRMTISYRIASESTETILAELDLPASWDETGLRSTSSPDWVEQLTLQLNSAIEAELAASETSTFLWNLFITMIVITVPGSIAYLTWMATLHWRGHWRNLAAAPLVILLMWVGTIVLSALTRPSSHRLWPFEIFIWAMATVVYLVVLMTAKKTFDKADKEDADTVR